VDPDQVTLWLVTLGSVLAVPDAFSYSTEKQTDEELNLTLALHLVHLRTSKIIFSQQALVVKRWQSGQPLSSDNFVRLLLTGAQRALHNDARARAALRGALQRRAFEGLSQEVYAISAKDVAIPEGFRQGIIQQFPPPKGDELLANLRELFALEVAHGLSGFRSVLPPIPEELVAELEVGSEQRPSLWATFSLGAIQDLNLPPGVKLDRTSDGLMVVSGQFPKPDFRLRVNFTYGEEECGRTEFQRATQGTLIVRLDEDAKSSRNELLRTRPVHARAAYPRGYPSAHRALSGCLKAAFLPENLKPAIVTKLSTP
jgi:hypothetical protein